MATSEQEVVRLVEEGLVLAWRRCEREKEMRESLKKKHREKLKQRHIGEEREWEKKKGRRKKLGYFPRWTWNYPNGTYGGNKGVYSTKC